LRSDFCSSTNLSLKILRQSVTFSKAFRVPSLHLRNPRINASRNMGENETQVVFLTNLMSKLLLIEDILLRKKLEVGFAADLPIELLTVLDKRHKVLEHPHAASSA
jgi:hypothetical protein